MHILVHTHLRLEKSDWTERRPHASASFVASRQILNLKYFERFAYQICEIKSQVVHFPELIMHNSFPSILSTWASQILSIFSIF